MKALLTKKKTEKPRSLPDEPETKSEDSSPDNIASTSNLDNQESLHKETLEGTITVVPSTEPSSSSSISALSPTAPISDIYGLNDDSLGKYKTNKSILSSEKSAEVRRKELFLRDQMKRNMAVQVLQVNEVFFFFLSSTLYIHIFLPLILCQLISLFVSLSFFLPLYTCISHIHIFTRTYKDEFGKILDSLEALFGRAARAAIGYLTFACDGVTDEEVAELYKLEDDGMYV